MQQPACGAMTPEWTYAFETIRVIIAASGPAVVAYVGLVLNRRLKSIDQAQWQNRKIIDLRLDIYKEVAPKLNAMYCFCRWIGEWKDISPADLVGLKRETDKTMNVYRHLFSDSLFEAYDAFIHTVFQTYNEPGSDARIRCEIVGRLGDRRAHLNHDWNPDWDDMFALGNVASEKDVEVTYNLVMSAFRTAIGLREAEVR